MAIIINLNNNKFPRMESDWMNLSLGRDRSLPSAKSNALASMVNGFSGSTYVNTSVDVNAHFRSVNAFFAYAFQINRPFFCLSCISGRNRFESFLINFR